MRTVERLALARVVARSDYAREITERNHGGRALRVGEAVALEGAFFVLPRRELLVVDLDVVDGDAVGAFEGLVAAAKRAGVAHLVCSSGQVGHRHGYFVVGGAGPLRAQLVQWCRARGLDVRDRGVRPPGTPHRSGVGRVELPDGVGVDEAIAVLGAGVDEGAVEEFVSLVCPVRLPGRVQVAVRYGHSRAGYASPSHGRMALAVGVRARGGSAALLGAILRDEQVVLGETFRMRDERWQAVEIRRLWDKAGVYLAQETGEGGFEAVRRVWAGVECGDWGGVAGGSDLAVLEEFFRVGFRVGSVRVGVSLLDVAVGAGVSLDTARVAVRRLVSAGWLQVVVEETARTSRVYELCLPAGVEVGDGVVGEVLPRGVFGDLGADEARWGALGKATVRVGRVVAAGVGLSVGAIGKKLRMRRASVRYHLRKLVSLGLVSERAVGWVGHVSRETVQWVCGVLGVDGVRQRQEIWVAQLRQARKVFLGAASVGDGAVGVDPPPGGDGFGVGVKGVPLLF